jgi:hypothetical protein
VRRRAPGRGREHAAHATPHARGQGGGGTFRELKSGDIRARRRLNAATFEALQRAFDKGGQKAIDKVMRTQPAIFLKMLVLLVPRELQVEHSGSVKEMTDQQIEDAIAAIKQMIAEREREAEMIDVTPTSPSMPDPVSGSDQANPLK